MLEYGTNVEETDEQGQTALMIAIQENTNGSHLEVIDAVLGAVADLFYTYNIGQSELFY